MPFGFAQEANLTREEARRVSSLNPRGASPRFNDATETKLSAIVRKVAS
jgi:hypothetical protein